MCKGPGEGRKLAQLENQESGMGGVGTVRLGMGSGIRWCKMRLISDFIWRWVWRALKDCKQEMKMISFAFQISSSGCEWQLPGGRELLLVSRPKGDLVLAAVGSEG